MQLRVWLAGTEETLSQISARDGDLGLLEPLEYYLNWPSRKYRRTIGVLF
jgi:hypothetical protein